MAFKNIANTIGKYFLAGTLLAGTAYSQKNEQPVNLKDFYPQPANLELFKQPGSAKKDLTKKVLEEKKEAGKANPIYSKGELTSAGNGFFLTSYVYPSGEINSDYDFRKMFSSNDKISYSAITSKKVKSIVDNSKSLDLPVKKHVMNLQRKVMATSPENYRKFDKAIRNGILTQKEMEEIGEGTYAYLVSTGEQGVVGFFEIKKNKGGNLERKVEGLSEPAEEMQASPDAIKDNPIQEYIDSGEYLWKEPWKKDALEAKPGTIENSVVSDKVSHAQSKGPHNYPDTSYSKLKNNIFNPVSVQETDSSHAVAVDSLMHPNAQDTLGRKTLTALEDSLHTAQDSVQTAKGIKFGVEASAGTEMEGVIGGFASVPVFPWLNLEAYAGFFASKGYFIARNASEIITAREKILIGPATYKQRTDKIKTNSKKSPIAEVGMGTIVDLGKNFGIPIRAGVEIFNNEVTKTGSSTIEFERNNALLKAPSIIENTIVENSAGSKFALSAGLAYQINSSLSVEALLNSGLENSGRLKLRWGF